jgi:hypothetical protein
VTGVQTCALPIYADYPPRKHSIGKVFGWCMEWFIQHKRILSPAKTTGYGW